jgi:hypothetical protein
VECSNLRAVALGAAPAEHGRVAVEMSTIQKTLISASRFGGTALRKTAR